MIQAQEAESSGRKDRGQHHPRLREGPGNWTDLHFES